MEHVGQPIDESQRIHALDLLRGVAVLGILLLNVGSFATISAAYFNPPLRGGLEGHNFVVWLAIAIVARMKFITVFSMLFGAGIVLMTERVAAREAAPARRHYRRMAVLLAIGMLHAYLLWHGDILVAYALCGMLVYPLRKLGWRKLVIIGGALMFVGTAIAALMSATFHLWPPEQLAAFEAGVSDPTAELIAAEVAAHRGGYLPLVLARIPEVAMTQAFGMLLNGLWINGGLLVAGMGLFKLGVPSGARSPTFYRRLLAAGLAIGLPATLYGLHADFAHGWSFRYSMFVGYSVDAWAAIPVALAWMAAVMLWSRTARRGWLERALAAVGRMALSNYILQSLICTTLFYGYGFGLYDRLDRLQQLGVVAAVWGLQLVLSPLWLRRFQFGPLEWLWRLGTYGAMPPMRRVGPRSGIESRAA